MSAGGGGLTPPHLCEGPSGGGGGLWTQGGAVTKAAVFSCLTTEAKDQKRNDFFCVDVNDPAR